MPSRSTLLKSGFFVGLLIQFGVTGAMMPVAAQGYTQEQQQLCSGDAFRLCGPEIPDVDRVTACMVRQRALLSPGCRSVFRYDPPAAMVAPTRVAQPMSIRAKAGKARKARKMQR